MFLFAMFSFLLLYAGSQVINKQKLTYITQQLVLCLGWSSSRFRKNQNEAKKPMPNISLALKDHSFAKTPNFYLQTKHLILQIELNSMRTDLCTDYSLKKNAGTLETNEMSIIRRLI